MPGGHCPGPDAFPAEWFKLVMKDACFGSTIEAPPAPSFYMLVLLKALNQVFSDGAPSDHNVAWICSILKGGLGLHDLGQTHGIALIEVFLKILAASSANGCRPSWKQWGSSSKLRLGFIKDTSAWSKSSGKLSLYGNASYDGQRRGLRPVLPSYTSGRHTTQCLIQHYSSNLSEQGFMARFMGSVSGSSNPCMSQP